MAQPPDDPYHEAGLGDFLEFSSDEKVMQEILGRADCGLVLLAKKRPRDQEGHTLAVRFKLTEEIVKLADGSNEKAVLILLDFLKGVIDVE